MLPLRPAVGLRSTSTIMCGHVDTPAHWARHLALLRGLQKRTGGISEFVPLPFVHMEAPLYLRGGCGGAGLGGAREEGPGMLGSRRCAYCSSAGSEAAPPCWRKVQMNESYFPNRAASRAQHRVPAPLPLCRARRRRAARAHPARVLPAARGGAPGAAPPHHQHPSLLGQDGAAACSAAAGW